MTINHPGKWKVAIFSCLTHPIFFIIITLMLFWGMRNNLGLRYVPTELNIQVEEKLFIVQQRPGLVDPDSVRRLDDLLQKNGWVDEISH